MNESLKQLNATLNDDARVNIDQTIEGTMKFVTALSELLESSQQDIETAIASGSSMIQQLDTLAADARPRADRLLTAGEANLKELDEVQAQRAAAAGNR